MVVNRGQSLAASERRQASVSARAFQFSTTAATRGQGSEADAGNAGQDTLRHVSTAQGELRPRLLGLVEGPPAEALSGVGQRLLDALAHELTVVGCLDYAPRGWARAALALRTFHPDRARWRGRFHTSLPAHQVLTRTLRRELRASPYEFDLALQVHGWVAGQPRPYALYVDQTRLMAQRGWPEWLPLPERERTRVLELERAMYAQASCLLVMGEPARASLIADYGVSPERVTVVGGGLMFDALPDPPAAPTAEPVITFVGREFERKGGDCLLAAFAHVREAIPEARLELVGVSAADALGRAGPAAGIRCHGKVSGRAPMSALYRGSRAFCMPSRYEPYGFALIEAMAHGVPCVGTTVQSIPEILDHGRAGLLVEPGDARGLAAALLRLLRDDELARGLGEAGRRRVAAELTWRQVAARAAPALRAAAGG